MEIINTYKKSDTDKGLIPAILYSEKNRSIPFKVSGDLILKLINKGAISTRVLLLEIEDKQYQVLIQDMQYNPINELPIHVDFTPVKKGEKQKVSVPFVILNKEISPGVKRGGHLMTLRRYVKIQGEMNNIPRVFTYDASNLNIGDKIKISHLSSPESCEFVDLPDTLLINLSGKKKKLTEEENTNV